MINIRTNLDDNGRVMWPLSPKDGDRFFHLDTISGADWVNHEYRGGKWQQIPPYLREA